MKSLRALKAAGLILAAVVLGLMTVQGSYALWNAAVSTPPAAVQAADFSILVNGNDMRGTQVPLQLGELTRGKTAYTAIEIKNNVNVTADSPFRASFDLTNLIPLDSFGGHLVVKTFIPAPDVKCASVPPASYVPAPANISSALALGSTQSICVAVELKGTTPATNLGNPIIIPVSLTVAQVAPGTK